jgi:hypothetical protein
LAVLGDGILVTIALEVNVSPTDLLASVAERYGWLDGKSMALALGSTNICAVTLGREHL